ncbi:MAG: tyrosine-type recombinase/integrase [Oscillospiraceae bacterium]|nr:tyrosine-type recombinase/integrase [Oscillospiraceae bacterium]
MKEELINNILMMLKEHGISINGLHDEMVLLFRNVECTPLETSLALIDETENERLIKAFLAAKMIKGCTEQTISFYGKELKQILEKIQKHVTEITADDIRVYIAYRLVNDKVSKTTADNEIRILRAFYAYLSANDIVSKNIMLQIECIKPDRKKKAAFTEMEVEQLRSACRDARETAVVELLLSTGCRVSELVSIQISEILNDRVTVHGKGNKDRIVYLNAKAQLAIQTYLSQRNDDNPYLFSKGIRFSSKEWNHYIKQNELHLWWQIPEMVGNGHTNKGSIEIAVRELGKSVGVAAHPHKFRRTCATLALRRGMPIEQVSKMLGHEQLTTTQLYLDLQEEELEIAHKKYVT